LVISNFFRTFVLINLAYLQRRDAISRVSTTENNNTHFNKLHYEKVIINFRADVCDSNHLGTNDF